MSAFTNAINKIERKKAGMFLLCNTISQNLEGQAKANAEWTDRSGHARQSLKGKASGSGSSTIINISYGVNYGTILEEGSKPHVINGNPFLYWKGAEHPVRSVNHPGTKGFKTLHNTVTSNLPQIGQTILEYWEE